jgi:hypothetical protein
MSGIVSVSDWDNYHTFGMAIMGFISNLSLKNKDKLAIRLGDKQTFRVVIYAFTLIMFDVFV